MTVHCLHIFDHKGKTLFTKTYSALARKQQQQLSSSATGTATGPTTNNNNNNNDDTESGDGVLDEQRKLVFGMLFSLREIMGSLDPNEDSSLNAIETGTTTVHNYETISGLRFALYTSNNVPKTSKRQQQQQQQQRSLSTSDVISAREVLQHIYAELWVDCVVRSPMYKPQGRVLTTTAHDNSMKNSGFVVGEGIGSAQTATFEKKLDKYLSSLPWFRDGVTY